MIEPASDDDPEDAPEHSDDGMTEKESREAARARGVARLGGVDQDEDPEAFAEALKNAATSVAGIHKDMTRILQSGIDAVGTAERRNMDISVPPLPISTLPADTAATRRAAEQMNTNIAQMAGAIDLLATSFEATKDANERASAGALEVSKDNTHWVKVAAVAGIVGAVLAALSVVLAITLNDAGTTNRPSPPTPVVTTTSRR